MSSRVSSGVPGFDEMLGGGYMEGDSILLAGSPGTGKTTAGLHFLAAGAAEKQPTLYVTFEYLPEQMYRDAEARGWDVRAWEEQGLVQILCTTPDVLLARAGPGQSILEEALRSIGARRLVIDSMAHFQFLGMAPDELRSSLNGLMNQLRILNVTTLLTHEIPTIIGPAVQVSEWGLEFLVDSVVMLRYVELEGEMTKAINILKMRGSAHDRRFRQLQLTDQGIAIDDGLANVERISGGTAKRGFAKRARGLI